MSLQRYMWKKSSFLEFNVVYYEDISQVSLTQRPDKQHWQFVNQAGLDIYVFGNQVHIDGAITSGCNYLKLARQTITAFESVRNVCQSQLELSFGEIGFDIHPIFFELFFLHVPRGLIQSVIFMDRHESDVKYAKASGKVQRIGVVQPYIEYRECIWSIQTHHDRFQDKQELVEWFMLFSNELPREILYLIFNLI